jgi:hypothetical protein
LLVSELYWCMTVAVFHFLMSCIGVHFFHVLLYTVHSCYSILQTAKLVRWKCWTIEICTDIGISKPIQPDTLINKTYPHYSMCWKCFTLLFITGIPIEGNIHKMKVLCVCVCVCGRTIVKLET